CGAVHGTGSSFVYVF
nr:immunoglobulin light chain junction region [Macaca mulatta]